MKDWNACSKVYVQAVSCFFVSVILCMMEYNNIDFNTLNTTFSVVWRYILKNKKWKRKFDPIKNVECRIWILVINSNLEITIWKKQDSEWSFYNDRVFVGKSILNIVYNKKEIIVYKHFLEIFSLSRTVMIVLRTKFWKKKYNRHI